MRTLLLVSFLTIGCAPIRPEVRPIPGPDGTMHQSIACGAVEDCYVAASSVCGGPYKIVNSTSSTNAIPQAPTSPVHGPILVTNYKLLVKCGVQ